LRAASDVYAAVGAALNFSRGNVAILTSTVCAVGVMMGFITAPLGPNGRITSRVEFLCEDDEAAQKQAKQLVDGHDVELWQSGRKVATFPHKPVR
jgi:hypothetical protein